MFTYFIPLTVNLTKNSKLEKFVHELNALWKLSGSSMGAPRELIAVAGIRFIQIGFLLSLTAFRFLQWLSDFLQRLSTFSNGFLIFSNGFPIFLNGFPLSEKSKKIYLWREVYERSLFKLRIFCHSLPELRSSR